MWSVAYDSHNRPYYYTPTGETTWTKPRELWTPVDEALHRENWTQYYQENGSPYWYNDVTKVSVAEMPEAGKAAQRQLEAKTNGVIAPVSPSEEPSQGIAPALSSEKDPVDGDVFADLPLDYSAALRTLVTRPAFWRIHTARQRHSLFVEHATAALRAEHRAAQKARAELIERLETEFAKRGVWTWPEADDAELPGSLKERQYAFAKARSEAREARACVRRKAEDADVQVVLEVLSGIDVEPQTDWVAVRATVEAKLGHPVSSRIVEEFQKAADQAYAARENHLREKLATLQKEGRTARARFVSKLEDLVAAGKITAGSKWESVVPLLEPEVKRLAGHEGSHPVELIWDCLYELQRKLKLQVEIAQDTLTAKGLNDVSFDTFAEMFSNDRRITDVRQVYDALVQDESSRRQQAKRQRRELEY